MAKKVLILSGSPRKNGNSDLLCNEFMRGALESGNEVTKIRVAEKKIAPCISAQLKAVVDRTVARWLEVKDKEFYYIATCAEAEPEAVETTFACFHGYADCVEGAVEKGKIAGIGVYEAGAVKETEYMKAAYEMGKGV